MNLCFSFYWVSIITLHHWRCFYYFIPLISANGCLQVQTEFLPLIDVCDKFETIHILVTWHPPCSPLRRPLRNSPLQFSRDLRMELYFYTFSIIDYLRPIEASKNWSARIIHDAEVVTHQINYFLFCYDSCTSFLLENWMSNWWNFHPGRLNFPRL